MHQLEHGGRSCRTGSTANAGCIQLQSTGLPATGALRVVLGSIAWGAGAVGVAVFRGGAVTLSDEIAVLEDSIVAAPAALDAGALLLGGAVLRAGAGAVAAAGRAVILRGGAETKSEDSAVFGVPGVAGGVCRSMASLAENPCGGFGSVRSGPGSHWHA